MKIAIVTETLLETYLFVREEFYEFIHRAWLHGHVVDTFDLGISYKEDNFKIGHVGNIVKDYDWCLCTFHVNPTTQAFFRILKKGNVKIAHFSHDLMTTSFDVISADGVVPELIFTQTLVQLNAFQSDRCPEVFKKYSKIVPIPSLKLGLYEDGKLREARRTKQGNVGLSPKLEYTEPPFEGERIFARDPKLVSIVVNYGVGPGRTHVDTRPIAELLQKGEYKVKYKGTAFPIIFEGRITEFHGLVGTLECVGMSSYLISEGSGMLVDAIYGGCIPILMVSSSDFPVVKVVGREGDVDIIDHYEEGGYPSWNVRKLMPVAYVDTTDKIGEPLLAKLSHLAEHYEENVKILQDAWCIKSETPAFNTILNEIENFHFKECPRCGGGSWVFKE